MLATLYESFWKAEYWLPPGYTWADLEDSDDITYPHPKDLLAVVPLTFVLLVIRYGSERIIGLPLSRAMGVRDPRRIKATPNPILESFFQTQNKKPEKDDLSHLASQCSLSVRQIQCWFRRRRNQERPLMSKKFSESCWRFLFYSTSFLDGLFVFYNETWFGKPETVWDGYPKQPLQPAIYWWYLLELSFYFSLLLTLSYDVKRKDFKEQVVHHFVAVTLILFSYSANFVHIGALVLLLHDVSDIFMEACKMLIYTKWRLARDTMFILFAMVFFICRLILFPIKVLHTTYYAFLTNYQVFFGYYFANVLLMVLQGLNAFWFFLILRMFCKLLSDGQVKNDVRSDTEEQDTSDEQLEMRQQKSGKLRSNDAIDIRARGGLKASPACH
ncbi:ceramide synthase 4-like isoform X1 [Monodelphis domestica]|nr:ceramide synthase 4-like isoform X1 [Monodelphis domestica]XP_007489543.1 ceramide synthase 4-like isoform X1 [Monodelphis domestica]XP_007489544.1 ceramide synthase 4-like isoform X1 [Monodelphis domestica]XP_007489545.1 ceramide synthase 4-like isoform X1 [Monodelphis domestica]XP_056678028.1 ceramide synthase 4-like isoform X1 [Monodelphis domestica]XP_056678029.1 ceramide synthase 4-like isoform X1 [Monodelphis domestica]XP_056678030.1 ceramide synthase 4-like isoform X1 [Monodelphis d